jgi:hypothetical protein
MASYRPQSVKLSDITITELKKNENNGGKTAYINHNGGRLRIRTEAMKTPFGVSVVNIEDIEKMQKSNASVKDINDAKKLGISLSIAESDHDFCNFINALDDKLLETAVERKFNPGTTGKEGYKAVHNRGIKIALDENGEPKPYPPTFRAAIPRDYNTKGIRTIVCGRERDATGKLIPIPVTCENISDVIPRGAKVRMVLECKSIYQVAGRFGITWNVAQVQVLEKPAPEGDFEFEDDHEYDLSSNQASEVQVDDTEVEVEDSEGEEELPKSESVEEVTEPSQEEMEEDAQETTESLEEEAAEEVVPKKSAKKTTKKTSVKSLLSQL